MELPITSELVPRVRTVRPRREGLTEARKRNAIALAEALWSRDGTSGPPGERLRVFAEDLSDFVGHLNTRARLLFVTCLAVITWLSPLVIGRMPRLARLDVSDRVRAIQALEQTPASLALLAAKAIVAIVWFEQPENAREIGWDQRCKR